MKSIDEEMDGAAEAILAVVAIARANFPDEVAVTISVEGKHSASVKVPHFVLGKMIQEATQ